MTYEDGRWQDGVGEAGQPVRAASIRRQNLDLVARPQVADDEGDFACRKDFLVFLPIMCSLSMSGPRQCS